MLGFKQKKYTRIHIYILIIYLEDPGYLYMTKEFKNIL